MTDSPDLCILTLRAKDNRYAALREAKTKCDTCGEECWLSKDAVLTIKNHPGQKVKVICTECMKPVFQTMKDGEHFSFMEPTEGQIKEIQQHMPHVTEQEIRDLYKSLPQLFTQY